MMTFLSNAWAGAKKSPKKTFVKTLIAVVPSIYGAYQIASYLTGATITETGNTVVEKAALYGSAALGALCGLYLIADSLAEVASAEKAAALEKQFSQSTRRADRALYSAQTQLYEEEIQKQEERYEHLDASNQEILANLERCLINLEATQQDSLQQQIESRAVLNLLAEIIESAPAIDEEMVAEVMATRGMSAEDISFYTDYISNYSISQSAESEEGSQLAHSSSSPRASAYLYPDDATPPVDADNYNTEGEDPEDDSYSYYSDPPSRSP